MPAQSALRHIRRAADCWSHGDAARADVHLALTGFPCLSGGERQAKRLFLAEELIKAGIGPATILKILAAEALESGSVHKRDVTWEPRNPQGDGTKSGEWTTLPSEADAPGKPTSPIKSVLEHPSAWPIFVRAARTLGPWAPLGLTLVSTNKSLWVSGDVPGYPGMTYQWNKDEFGLHLRYQGPDGGLQTIKAHFDGKLLRDEKGRVIGRVLPDEKVVIDPAVAFELKQREEPKKCPAPGPDYPGRRSETSLRYEDYIKALLNPLSPTPRRVGVQLPSLLAVRGLVYYDDCQRNTGMLAEMKWGYTDFIASLFRRPFTNLSDSWVAQATKQIDASQGRPVTWFFSERIPAQFARQLFDANPTLARINVVYAPYRPRKK